MVFNVVSSTPRHEQGSNSQFYWWQALIAQVVVNPFIILSLPLYNNNKKNNI
jgi:hypothetical protein